MKRRSIIWTISNLTGSVFNAVFQERSLASLQSSLESMKATAQSLNAELGTALLAQLSVEDQHEVDRLNDEIQELTAKNRKALEERVKVC
jgi:structural maintenance of chromosome 3 (chondroitin sulfate proteoglycan 6)